ncbi:MAG: YkgJ family cysteine cluster protein [Polyangiaceae bacterium]
MSDAGDAVAACAEFHREVDEQVAPLATFHGRRLQCRRGCYDCCSDDLTVLEVEAELIRTRHEALLREQEAGPVGGCAFLDADGGCRIYADRPYVCRTQGLPLRFYDEDDAGEIHEHRDICPKNLPGLPLANLDEARCLLLGPSELRLVSLQMQGFSRMRRVALRDLFLQR